MHSQPPEFGNIVLVAYAMVVVVVEAIYDAGVGLGISVNF